MAVIDPQLNELKEATSGQASRKIVVEILKKINVDGSDAKELDGKPASDYVLRVDMDRYFKALMDSIRKTDKLSNNEETKDCIPMTKAIFEVFGDLNNFPT